MMPEMPICSSAARQATARGSGDRPVPSRARRYPWLAATVLVAFLVVILALQVPVPGPDGTLVPGAIPEPAQTAYNGPHTVPGRVQAEEYDSGGPDVAYSDSTPENIGGAGRLKESVDVRLINGITDIAYIGPGEWTEYTVDVVANGTDTAHFRLGGTADDREVLVSVDGIPGCTVNVPNTGSYQVYQTVSAPLALTKGRHVIRLTFTTGYVSIDWFEVVPGGTTGRMPAPTTVLSTATITAPPPEPFPSGTRPHTDLVSAYAAGTQRLEEMRAAYRAWAIPIRADLVANATDVRAAGLASNGAADTTAPLQALLDSMPPGATLYFPAGTYRIDGPVSISKPVTLVGEPGTVFGCGDATTNVFTINRAGSLSSKMSGVTITGIVFEGPGLETEPTMIDGYYLHNFRVQHVRFHNVGYAAIRVKGCSDVVVEDCVFDNVFMKGYGYGVAILDYSDDITVRDSFFVTKGRHGVTTGTANNDLAVEGYTKKVTLENNYMESMTDQAIDAHDETAGPYIARRNVIVNSRRGVNLRNGIADISENVFVNCPTAIVLRNSQTKAPGNGSASDRVAGNIIINARAGGMEIETANSAVTDNVVLDAYADGERYNGNVSTEPSPRSVVITGSIMNNWTDVLDRAVSSPGMSLVTILLRVNAVPPQARA
jgi:hypothetical protein